MAFYWKYSRNGYISKTYKSFIIDVLPSSWSIINNRRIWHTSFEELEAFLILLQDIEGINNPNVGATKTAYAQFVMLNIECKSSRFDPMLANNPGILDDRFIKAYKRSYESIDRFQRTIEGKQIIALRKEGSKKL